MTQQEKLQAIRQWLKDNEIKYTRKFRVKTNDGGIVIADIQIFDSFISIHVSKGKEDEEDFFKKVSKIFHPVFIREEETVEFIIEKIQNTRIRHFEEKRLADIRRAERQERHLKLLEEEKLAKARRIAEKKEKQKKKLAQKQQEQSKPKRKRMRIVNYEKVEPIKKY